MPIDFKRDCMSISLLRVILCSSHTSLPAGQSQSTSNRRRDVQPHGDLQAMQDHPWWATEYRLKIFCYIKKIYILNENLLYSQDDGTQITIRPKLVLPLQYCFATGCTCLECLVIKSKKIPDEILSTCLVCGHLRRLLPTTLFPWESAFALHPVYFVMCNMLWLCWTAVSGRMLFILLKMTHHKIMYLEDCQVTN